MAKSLKKFLGLLSLTSLLLSITLSGCLFVEQIETVTDREARDYSFNSATILERLNSGDKSAFALTTTVPFPNPSLSGQPVDWISSDFLQVAQALLDQAWGEPLGISNLRSMTFHRDCSGIALSFDDAVFEYYRIDPKNRQNIRIDFFARIVPAYNYAYTSKTMVTPNTHNMIPLDPETNRITAEEALQIAEQNGGSIKREGAGNACKISILIPDFDSKWSVMYLDSQNPLESLFTIRVDPQTGEFKVLKQRQ